MLEGTAGHASELKQQGALEASRDPNSDVSAKDAEAFLLKESRAAGAAAFAFNPDASKQEKTAQIQQVRDELGRPHRQHKTAALASDQDDGTPADLDLPPPTTAGALAISPTAEVEDEEAKQKKFADKVGWAPRFGQPKDADDGANLMDHQTWIEGKLDDRFYGDWYHNAGIMIFACLGSWTVAVLGGGLGWIFLIMAICATYYRTSLRRVRRNFKDDIRRELAKSRLETDTESLEWMNSFLVKFWPIYAPVLCQTIVASVDQVLSTSTPAFLDSMRLKFFTLGTKPPRMEHVKTYPKSEDDLVIMDWKFSFTPNDISDLTSRQIKNKINPKVVLEVRVGKAMVSKGLDIIVEDMACSGTMRVKLKLQIEFPHIERVEICFLGRPTFDYKCKPIGGDHFGFDINFLPGLEGFIQEQIHANLAPMMYDPNVFPIEVAKMLAGSPVDQAIGVLQVTFHGAQGLKNQDKFSGTPDPYACVSINARETLGRTKTVHESENPRWNETFNLILTSLKEPLTMYLYDYNEYRKDKELGIATFQLQSLMDDPVHENMQLEVIANGRPRGILQCDIRFFPVLEGVKNPDGTTEPPPESMTGIAKFTIEQAKDLDGSRGITTSLNPYAVLYLNQKEVQVSKKLKHTNNPIWDNASKEILITDRKHATLGVAIKDDRDLSANPLVGTYNVKLEDMLDLMSKGQEWYQLAGAKSGRVKMTLQWKPVALTGAAVGSGGYVTPIGVMRIHFKGAKDLRNRVGTSDPYARALLSGVQKCRTVTFTNNLSPEWDEIFYVPVHSTRERLTVEVMDEEDLHKDRTLGAIEIPVSDYVKQGDDGQYLAQDTKNDSLSRQLRVGNNPPKGILNFTLAFYPTIPTIDPEDEEAEEAKGKVSMESAPKTNGNGAPLQGRERSMTSGTVSSVKSRTTGNSIDMAKTLENNAQHQAETQELKADKPKSVEKIRVTTDDLTKYESGLIIFKIIDADFSNPGSHLEMLIDDMLFPAYSSTKAKSQHFTFNETGDAMIRELDLSRLTLRLVSEVKKKGNEDEKLVKAKVTANTLDVLRKALYTPTQIAINDENGGVSKVTLSLRYIPVKMQLDPSESFNNSGSLRVEVLDGADLPAADRNGFSDPFCKFMLNDKEVFKTKTQKKTLHPVWNEFFETQIRSRTAARFVVDVYDWDFADSADFLGSAKIAIDLLEPFQATEVTLALDGKSGAVRLKLLFKPSYVVRSRQGSSTFHGSFGVPGKVVGVPIKGVGRGISAVGGGVGKAGSFIGRGFKRRTASGNVVNSFDSEAGSVLDVSPTTMDSPNTPSPTQQDGQSIEGIPARDISTPNSRAPSQADASLSPGSESGMATISVLSASGFETDAKLEVRVLHDSGKGLKKVFETKAIKPKDGQVTWEHESKKETCHPADKFRLSVRSHKTFGSDEIGEADFFIDDQGSGSAKQINVGKGTVTIQSSFQPVETSSLAPGESPQGRKVGRLLGRRSSRSGPPAS